MRSILSLRVSVFLRLAFILFERLWLFGLFWVWFSLGMASLGLGVGALHMPAKARFFRILGGLCEAFTIKLLSVNSSNVAL